jgi:hypothetical protein
MMALFLKIWGIWHGSFQAMLFFAKCFVALMGGAKGNGFACGMDLVIGLF